MQAIGSTNMYWAPAQCQPLPGNTRSREIQLPAAAGGGRSRTRGEPPERGSGPVFGAITVLTPASAGHWEAAASSVPLRRSQAAHGAAHGKSLLMCTFSMNFL